MVQEIAAYFIQNKPPFPRLLSASLFFSLTAVPAPNLKVKFLGRKEMETLFKNPPYLLLPSIWLIHTLYRLFNEDKAKDSPAMQEEVWVSHLPFLQADAQGRKSNCCPYHMLIIIAPGGVFQHECHPNYSALLSKNSYKNPGRRAAQTASTLIQTCQGV